MLIFRSKLIPKLLEPQSKNSDALFTDELFKEFIVPQVELYIIKLTNLTNSDLIELFFRLERCFLFMI